MIVFTMVLETLVIHGERQEKASNDLYWKVTLTDHEEDLACEVRMTDRQAGAMMYLSVSGQDDVLDPLVLIPRACRPVP